MAELKTSPLLPAPPRKGAARISAIAPEVLAGMNAGLLESMTLVECLAVDYVALLQAVVPQATPALHAAMVQAQSLKATHRLAHAGAALLEHLGTAALPRFATHRSDTVRSWAAGMICGQPKRTLQQKLHDMAPLADDPNFGVREWAWLVLRPHIKAELPTALAELTNWAKHPAANLRRFASEATRPRGVWCAHLEVLKRDPTPALPILEPLRSDPSRYVQNSVANWLNDSFKDQPAFVHTLTQRWLAESATPETAYICQRALRSQKP